MKKLIGFVFLLLVSCVKYSTGEIEAGIPIESIPPEEFTPLSFREDPIYSQIDPMDPYSFLDAFLKDAKRHGVDIPSSSIETIKFEFLDKMPFATRRYGAAAHVCVPNKVYLLLETKFWNDAKTLEYEDYAKIKLMWHEFGHSILKLDHTCIRGHIMTSNTPSCPETELGWFYDLWYFKYTDKESSINWQRAVKDMFEGIEQVSFNCNVNTQSIYF